MIRIARGTIGIKEREGRLPKVLQPGIHFYIPILDSVDVLPTSVQVERHNEIMIDRNKAIVNVHIEVYYKIYKPILAYQSGSPLSRIEKVSRDILPSLILSSTTVMDYIVTESMRKSLRKIGYDVVRVSVTVSPSDIIMDDILKRSLFQEISYL
jgi:regulator of protease activity HflC (stomatin/prohibitin superfamily)